MLDLEENSRKLKDINNRFASLENTIGKIDELKTKLDDLEKKTIEDGFWEDSKKSNIVLQEIKDVKSKYTSLIDIKQTLESLIEINQFLLLENDEELSKELLKNTSWLEKKLENLEIKMLLSGKFDKNNAIITLHPGAGRYGISGLGSNAL